jgi:NAD(P)-dependent dehydrogenase (short-subunit alcohol dehydrogenase family)
MSRALVIGASGGIGGALVRALEARSDAVHTLSRSADGFDITDEASIARALSGLSGAYDTILVATGALEIGGRGPEKTIKALDPDTIARHFALNATGPALVLKHALRLMPRDRRAVFAALSARVGSISDNRLGGWYSYRASKAALNQLIHTGAVEVARSHRRAIVVALHPGTVATRFTANYPGHAAVPAPQAAANLLAVLDGLTPEQSGGFFDWSGARVAW